MGDATDDVMEATYRALCAHGYADLTMQDIADESALSKAALHYHFDTKHDLLVTFLEHLFDRFRERVGEGEGTAPERLLAFVDDALHPPEDDDEFRTALLEITAQAPYDAAYRERLLEFDRFLSERVRTIVAGGIESGTIRPDADPDDVAAFVVTAINGAHTRRVAVGDAAAGGAGRVLEAYVERLATEEDTAG